MHSVIKYGKPVIAVLALAVTVAGEGRDLTTLEVSLIVSAFSVGFAALLAFAVRQNKRLTDAEMRCSELETKISPLWARVQAQISEDLHHPDVKYTEMDNLLEKLDELTLSPSERIQLKHLLTLRSRDHASDISDLQRMKAKIMSQVMDLVVAEAANGKINGAN